MIPALLFGKPHDAAVGAFLLGVKIAADPEVSYDLSGRLYVSASGWLLLAVPNNLARGLFSAINETGLELPPGPDVVFNAAVAVMQPEEVEALGGRDRITERGKSYRYTVGRFYVAEPTDWPEMSKVWSVRIHSPELQELRRSYGLSSLPGDGAKDFHVPVAVRRRGVLGRNEKSKATS